MKNYVTYVKDREQIDFVNSLIGIKEVIFQANKFSSKENKTDFDEVLKLAELVKNDIKKYFSLDIIPFNEDLEKINNILKVLSSEGFYGVRIQDLSVLNMILEKNYNLKVVLDSTTGGNNIEYYNFFSKFESIERVVLSRELTKDKLLKFSEGSKINLELQVYGLLQIFHTRRKLINTLNVEKNLKLPEVIYLREPKRKNEYFPLMQTSDGTFMFNSKIINLYDFLDEFSDNGVYFLLDLRHLNNFFYKKTIKHFLNLEKTNFQFEKLSFMNFGNVKGDLPLKIFDKNSYKRKKIGVVLDVKKGDYMILKSETELKLDMQIVFYNNKGKELFYKIRDFSNYGDSIYIVAWMKGVTANSSFYEG